MAREGFGRILLEFGTGDMAMLVGKPGQIFAERYKLVSTLGKGGMGTVWKAEHLALGSTLALKLLESEVALSEQGGRFEREARAAAALRSPNVVQIFDYGVEADGTAFIAMELLEGENLAQRLDRVGRLGIEDTSRVLLQVARGVQRAHDAGIIHRDLKPQNIFLVREEDQEVAKVLDFGIAKRLPTKLESEDGSLTGSGVLLGTPFYMSPEQARGRKEIDAGTDIWSLGVIAYECLLGRLPFEASNLGDLVLRVCADPPPVPSEHGAVPKGFDAWFAKACARDRSERFRSARELALAFAGLAELSDSLSRFSQPSIRIDHSRAETLPASGSVPGLRSDSVSTAAVSADGYSLGRVRRAASSKALYAIVGVLALGAGLFGIRRLLLPGPREPAASTSALTTPSHSAPPLSSSASSTATGVETAGSPSALASAPEPDKKVVKTGPLRSASPSATAPNSTTSASPPKPSATRDGGFDYGF